MKLKFKEITKFTIILTLIELLVFDLLAYSLWDAVRKSSYMNFIISDLQYLSIIVVFNLIIILVNLLFEAIKN